MRIISCAAAVLALAAVAAPASASLSVFKTFIGSYGLSTDGGGSTTNSYDISAFAPVGAVVEGAWLYQSNFNFDGTATPYAISLDGNALAFGPSVVNGTDCCGLNSARADVTSIVKAKVDGGAGGTYNFAVRESDAQTDGTALVVVYSLASLDKSTVAILDGFSDVGGDGFTASFGSALDPTAAGFQADLRLGIGFSCCGQTNTIKVNGTTITENAGNFDDGDNSGFNGNLITVGGNDDPFSGLLPSYDDDRERYSLTPYVTLGDTSIKVETLNPSADDNIFLAAFIVTGEGVIVTPGIPEPATWAMLITGFGLVGFTARRRRSALASA